ncbi:MAG: T9SS type A sorting domain-containing protein, partial [Ferruginibacter sp.]
FMYTANTDSVILNRVYTEGFTSGYNYGNARYAEITNSWFKDVKFGIGYSSKNPVSSIVKNVFIKTSGNDKVSGILVANNTSLKLINSIIHIVNTYKIPNGARGGNFVNGLGSTENKIEATGNIFICDIDPSKSLTAAITNTNKGAATSTDKWNNNVYILLRGKSILWTASNASTNNGNNNINNLEIWKQQSGQDEHSLFFDLRYDRRGLKAIFVDPENGNYELANTREGNQVAALKAGMTSPITCFLQKPTYEAAADLISNDNVLSPVSCRYPCEQNRIRVNNTFDISAVSNRQVSLKWNIQEQQNTDHYEIERSTEYSLFKRISSVSMSPDSSYSYTDDIQPGIDYKYRLVLVPKAGGKCYSDIRTVKMQDNKAFTIYPNPSAGKIIISLNGYIGRTNFTVSNSFGQIILTKESVSLYRAQELDLTHLPAGIYFLKVETGKGSSVQRFILE